MSVLFSKPSAHILVLLVLIGLLVQPAAAINAQPSVPPLANPPNQRIVYIAADSARSNELLSPDHLAQTLGALTVTTWDEAKALDAAARIDGLIDLPPDYVPVGARVEFKFAAKVLGDK
jgi:hypothetical protein